MQYKPSMACSAAQGLPLGLLLGFWVLQELRIGKPVDTGHIQKPHGKRWTTLVKRATCVGVSLAVMLLLVVEKRLRFKKQTRQCCQVVKNRQAHLAYDFQLFGA